MTEAERINLYNDLCDYEDDLRKISYPSQTKAIDMIHRAIVYVRGTSAKWLTNTACALPVLDESNRLLYHANCTCSSCGFIGGMSTFKLCPNCGSRMRQ